MAHIDPRCFTEMFPQRSAVVRLSGRSVSWGFWNFYSTILIDVRSLTCDSLTLHVYLWGTRLINLMLFQSVFGSVLWTCSEAVVFYHAKMIDGRLERSRWLIRAEITNGVVNFKLQIVNLISFQNNSGLDCSRIKSSRGIKLFFTAYVFCSLSLVKFKTEGRTIYKQKTSPKS